MKNLSPQILNASSNLLGFCFVILTSIKVYDLDRSFVIDEILAVALVLFMASCLFSFVSIRRGEEKSSRLELIAEISFLLGLVLLFCTTLLFAFDFIK